MAIFRRNPKKLKESRQAVLDANKALARVTEQGAEVRDLAQTLRDIRERNHFADQLRLIMGGR